MYKSLYEELEPTINIICVGSILLTDNLIDFLKDKPKNFVTEKVTDYLDKSDIFYGNLRNLFSKKGTARKNIPYDFRINPKYVSFIKKIGFSALNVINNHSYDFGFDPFNDNIIKLKNKRILTIGNPYDPVDFVNVIKGKRKEKREISISFLGYFIDEISYSRKDVLTDINLARSKSNCVFVSVYFSDDRKISDELDFCKKMIDSGADFILGYSQIKNQNVEQYNNGYIVHSMGNFITDKNKDIYGDSIDGILLDIIYNYKEDRFESVTTKHILINEEYQPDIVGDNENI